MDRTACSLLDKKCVPCDGGVPALNSDQIEDLMKELEGWTVVEDKLIEKDFKLKNFKAAISFINQIAEIAEQEGHHPDLNLYNWNKVKITLSTHAIKGLSENDFILAAKIDNTFKEI
ncbi:MAG: 4a-hydroxytetrahydrobiopterin dehydratase [Patescibacteria group bacterium]